MKTHAHGQNPCPRRPFRAPAGHPMSDSRDSFTEGCQIRRFNCSYRLKVLTKKCYVLKNYNDTARIRHAAALAMRFVRAKAGLATCFGAKPVLAVITTAPLVIFIVFPLGPTVETTA